MQIWRKSKVFVTGLLGMKFHMSILTVTKGGSQHRGGHLRNRSPSGERYETAQSTARRTTMKPEKFDAKRVPLNTFLIQFETCSCYNNWSEAEKAAQLKCSLTGDAAQILWDSPEVDKMNFSQLVDKLKGRYGTAGQREKFAVELRALRRKRNQSIAELYHDVRRLLVLAYPGCGNSELFEVIGRDHFLRALDDVELEMKVRDKEPEDLDAAFKAALRIEACIKSLDVEERIPRVRRSREEERTNRQVRPRRLGNSKQDEGTGAPGK
jgi:hypothetical protein